MAPKGVFKVVLIKKFNQGKGFLQIN